MQIEEFKPKALKKETKKKRERKKNWDLASYARRRDDKNQPLANADRCKKGNSFVMKISRRRWGCADDQDGVLLPGVAPARSAMNPVKKPRYGGENEERQRVSRKKGVAVVVVVGGGGRVGDDELMTTDNGDAMDLDDGGTDGGGRESGGKFFGVARREGGEMTVRAVIAVLVVVLVIAVVMMEIRGGSGGGRKKESESAIKGFPYFFPPQVGEIFSFVFLFPLGGCE